MKNQLTILILLIFNIVTAQDYQEVINLRGEWKFTIGDHASFKDNKSDDFFKDRIKVPGNWESQGFQGYNGFAWYKKEFFVPKELKKYNLIIDLGNIDDVDETFLNGKLIGATGTFPPNYKTAYNSHRIYYLPKESIKFGATNYLCIRVYDSEVYGGILRGDISIKKNMSSYPIDIDLAGSWDFYTNNSKCPEKILVPAEWENQGYKNYNGKATYTKEFYVDESFAKKSTVIIIGKIDDSDRVYVNGKLVGSMGNFRHRNHYDEHLKLRNYYLQENTLKVGKNVIKIEVYDFGGRGGIYKGPVGITSQDKYIMFWNEKAGR